MYEVECAYRRENGVRVFMRDDQLNEETDRFCDMRVYFDVTDIYPAEASTGAAMDWNGDIVSIEIRPVGWGRWHGLEGADFEAAKTFLLREHAKALWEKGGQYAETLHFSEAA